MQITHEEAHRLIQFNADNALNSQEKAVLSSHLEECIECCAYAEETKEVENILAPMLKRQWNLQPAPLSIDAAHIRKTSGIQSYIILAMRKGAIGAVFLAFIFSAWQFALSGRQKSSPVLANVLPVPTPSAQSTSTKAMLHNCEGMLWTVRASDTLESIAQQFLVSKDEIMAVNNLKTEIVSPGMELFIPFCNLTPTRAIHPTVLTTTYIPSTNPATSTPDG